MKLLKQCATPFGSLDITVKDKIKSYIENPCPASEDWDEVCHSMITGTGMTLWQIVCDMDPSFPRSGRTTDQHGNMIKDWERIPSGFDVASAIRWHFRKKEALKKEQAKQALLTK